MPLSLYRSILIPIPGEDMDNELVESLLLYLNQNLDYKITKYDPRIIGQYTYNVNIEGSMYVEFCGNIYKVRIVGNNIEILYFGLVNASASSLQVSYIRQCIVIDLVDGDPSNILQFFKLNEAISTNRDRNILGVLSECINLPVVSDNDDELIFNDCDIVLNLRLSHSAKAYELYDNYRLRTHMILDDIELFGGLLGDNSYTSYCKGDLMLNIIYNYKNNKDRKVKGFNLRDVRSYKRIVKWFGDKKYMNSLMYF